MDEGTGKFHSPSAGDTARDVEIFWRSIPCRIFSESSGASQRGLCVDRRNGGTVAWDFLYSAAKLAILPARGLLLFYEYLCSLAGKLRWSTWIGGEPEIWQILVYYVFLLQSCLWDSI